MSQAQKSDLISVIMPCYKMGNFITEALASVAAQTYNDWEAIVVDDAGPEDGTKEAVEVFARDCPHHRVEFIRHDRNRGVSAARNTAMHAAHGKWLAFLDPDDVWLPEKLDRQLEQLRSAPGNVGCFAFGHIERVGAGNAYAPGASIMGVAPRESDPWGPQIIAEGKAMFPFSTFIVRRDAVESVGGFCEGLPFQNEDRLFLGCVSARGKLTWLAEPLCIYRVHDGSATTTVIQQNAAIMVEFDLCARLVLWLRKQSGQHATGRRLMSGMVLNRLRQLLSDSHWRSWRGIVVDLSIQLALAYPRQLPRLSYQFFRQSSAIRFIRRLLRLTLKRVSPPGEVL